MSRGYVAIGLDRCKNPYNLGSVLRAAHCYDASIVVVGGGRIKHVSTDTTKAWRHIPCVEVAQVMDAMPHGAIPVVVELTDNATLLPHFTHPERAFYIFGPEDGSVRKEIIERAPLVVQVPTKFCMNLAATVNVVLYDRLMKEMRK
jgi:tRNA(Leu) C34 or U34 (ribose-2'-O)-methylase TrmL